jgi:DNA-3-methyladenine glycosylase I
MTILETNRCSWPGSDPLYQAYHDQEWGVPIMDDQTLFEKLILDGFQAGLSWITILKKRENFLKAFDSFEPKIMIDYGPEKVTSLMKDKGIIRNRLKIENAINNAKALLELQDSGHSFSVFLWRFVDGSPIQNSWITKDQVPVKTQESKAMSDALKKRGFRFCGPIICYAFMQAVGMVNDHTTDCFRHAQLKVKK